MHITGTKGKGSTSAFVERICRGKIQEEGADKATNEEVALDGFEEDEKPWAGGIGGSTSTISCQWIVTMLISFETATQVYTLPLIYAP